jgi:hypothetical protein
VEFWEILWSLLNILVEMIFFSKLLMGIDPWIVSEMWMVLLTLSFNIIPPAYHKLNQPTGMGIEFPIVCMLFQFFHKKDYDYFDISIQNSFKL